MRVIDELMGYRQERQAKRTHKRVWRFKGATMVSARWLQLKSVLRPHLAAPLRGVPPQAQYRNVMGLLRTLANFQANTPLQRADACAAHLEISVLVGPTASRELPTSRRRVATRLWTAVLPWESARGLSGTAIEKLIPKKILDAPVEVLSSSAAMSELMQTVAASESEEQLADAEVGMMFVTSPDVATSPEAASFWSGAISGPIDIAFFQKVDNHGELREQLAAAAVPNQARRLMPASPHFDPHSIRGHGIELTLVDQGKLEPFCTHDRVWGTPLVRLFPDLYARRRDSMSPPEDLGRCTEVTSRAGRIAVILELRRRYFFDHISSVLRSASPTGDAVAEADVHVELQLSDALHDEILEKQQLQRTMIVELEAAIRELIQLARSGEFKSRTEGETRDDEAVERAAANGWSGDTTQQGLHDRDEVLPVVPVTMTFEGRVEGSEGGSHKRHTSASERSKYPDCDPRMAVQPKLPYELITLAYRLNLCAWEISSLGARMIRELSDEAFSGVNEADIRNLVSLLDTSLIVPDELRGAIRASAARLGVSTGSETVQPPQGGAEGAP